MPMPLTLADLCARVIDCKNRTPPEAPRGDGFAYAIGTPQIRDGRIDLSDAKLVSRETFDIWTTRAVPQEDDVVLTREAPVGRVARVLADMKICLGQRTMLLRPNLRVTDPRFLHYLLLGPEVQGSLHARASGSTVPHLRVEQVRDLPIPRIPPLSEQKAMGELLSALDDKIAVNERIADLYERILSQHFSVLGIVNEPDEARAIPLTEIVDFNPTMSRPQGELPVYVDMAALPTSHARIQSWVRREPKSGARFCNGDTLLARITPCLENGKTGYVDFMADGEIGLGSTEFIVMRSRPSFPSYLTYFIARSARFREHAVRNMVGSSGRQRVSASAAATFIVNPPDLDAVARFGALATASFDSMKSLDAESRTLADLRDTLLPKLMSGELRIKDAERIAEEVT